VGIARDAAGRGLRVLLVEAQDLASATSSASSKLVHGGLRYLEQYEFRLVRESLIEREVLLKAAPHIIWPLRFVLPHHAGLRPAWMLRAGLFLYDHLGPRERLPAARGLDLSEAVEGAPLKASYRRGFAYSDCWVEDSRLVALVARDAADRGADIRPRTRLVSATRGDEVWTAQLEGAQGGSIEARAIVNAAGPWVGIVAETILRIPGPPRPAVSIRPPGRRDRGGPAAAGRPRHRHGRGSAPAGRAAAAALEEARDLQRTGIRKRSGRGRRGPAHHIS
jgi:glycerol-3-phosphate dehydrogenase